MSQPHFFIVNETDGPWPDYAIGPFDGLVSAKRFRDSLPVSLRKLGTIGLDVRDLDIESPYYLTSLHLTETPEGWNVHAPPPPSKDDARSADGLLKLAEQAGDALLRAVYSGVPDAKERIAKLKADMQRVIDENLPPKEPHGDA